MFKYFICVLLVTWFIISNPSEKSLSSYKNKKRIIAETQNQYEKMKNSWSVVSYSPILWKIMK